MTNIEQLLKEGVEMDKLIKILHVDPDYKVTYFIFRSGTSTHSSLPLQQAIELLKTEDFDLIFSDPHNMAILAPQNSMDSSQFKEDEKSYMIQ